MKTAESKVISFGDSLELAGEKWTSAADKIGSIGTKLTLGVTTPIIGIGTAAVNAGNDFESPNEPRFPTVCWGLMGMI